MSPVRNNIVKKIEYIAKIKLSYYCLLASNANGNA